MSCLIKSRGCFCARAAKEARSAIVKSIMEIPSGCGFSAQPNISCRSQPNTRLRGEFAGKFARKIHGAQYCGTQVEVKRLRHCTVPSNQPSIHPPQKLPRVVPFHSSLDRRMDRDRRKGSIRDSHPLWRGEKLGKVLFFNLPTF